MQAICDELTILRANDTPERPEDDQQQHQSHKWLHIIIDVSSAAHVVYTSGGLVSHAMTTGTTYYDRHWHDE